MKSKLRFLARFFIVTTTVLACALAIAGCDEDLIDDATFRLWCGESLCSWKLDQGHVRQAPTWHKNDFGVELVDTPTTISQELKNNAKCMTFTTIADVDPNAQVSVGLDFNGDGKIDYDQPIAAVGFREVKTQVTAPRSSGKLPRIFITKRGTGRAVLAQIRLQGNSNCNAPPFRMKDRQLGEPCDQPADSTQQSECKSDNTCCEGICAECCVAPKAWDFVPDGGGSGIAKPPEVKCRDNGVCERRDVKHLVFFTESVPLQCNPGRRDRPSGTTCLADDDCQSGSCEGATSTAFDKDQPANSFVDAEARKCPSDFPDAGPKESCELVNVTPGTCR
jgi:hypothetical protein